MEHTPITFGDIVVVDENLLIIRGMPVRAKSAHYGGNVRLYTLTNALFCQGNNRYLRGTVSISVPCTHVGGMIKQGDSNIYGSDLQILDRGLGFRINEEPIQFIGLVSPDGQL